MAGSRDMFRLYLFALLQGVRGYSQHPEIGSTTTNDGIITEDGMVTSEDFLEEEYALVLGKSYMVYVHPKIGESEQTYRSDGTTTVFEELQFQCLLINVNPDWYYDIKWYINDIQLPVGSVGVPAADLPSAVLREQHWSPSFKLGMQVRCAVAARFFRNAIAGRFQESKPFFAGIHVSTSFMSVKEGETTTVNFRSSVPLACWKRNGKSQRCQLQLEAVTSPSEHYCPRWSAVSVNDPASLRFCGPMIDSAKWDDLISMNVTGFYSDMYGEKIFNISTTTKRHIPLSGSYRDIWDGVMLPPIQVHVEKRHLNNSNNSSKCYVHSGMHIRTFDGRYYKNMVDGIYILYQHRQLPYSVHLMQRRCSGNQSKPMCSEGVAVQSGEDIFIMALRTSGHIKSRDRYTMANEESTVKTYGSFRSGIKVIRGGGYAPYEIHLPSGTRIQIGVSISYVYVYPSPHDRTQTEGLCGSYDGDPCNDFLFRDGLTQLLSCPWPSNPSSLNWYQKQPSDFILSWHVQQSENLFHGVPSRLHRNLSMTVQGFHCSCQLSDSLPTWDGLSTQEVQWYLHPPRIECIRGGGRDVTALYASPYKGRLLLNVFNLEEDDLPMPTFSYDTSIPDATFQGGWTTAAAKEYCDAFFTKHPVYQPCKNVPNVDWELIMAICMLDIQITGETNWANLSLESLREQCHNEVFKNGTLWISDDGKSILDLVVNSACPLDCNNLGHCLNGTCQCDPGFGGSDCSIEMGAPPVNIRIPKSGLCDLSKKKCRATKVYGRSFIESRDLTCRLLESQVNNSGLHLTGHTKVVKAIFINAHEVVCPLPYRVYRRASSARKPWLWGYKVSISNNGKDFSENSTILPYDSTCFKCDFQHNTLRCILKVEYCYIDHVCRPSMSSDASLSCRVCDPTQAQLDWTYTGAVKHSRTGRKTCASSSLDTQRPILTVWMFLSFLIIF